MQDVSARKYIAILQYLIDIAIYLIYLIFQDALIHQSDAWTGGGIKTYILLPVFYCTVRIVNVNPVIHSKLCAPACCLSQNNVLKFKTSRVARETGR